MVIVRDDDNGNREMKLGRSPGNLGSRWTLLFFFGAITTLFDVGALVAQEFRITGIQIGPGGRAQIRHSSRIDHYYLLLRGTSPLDMTVAVKAALYGGTNGLLIDSTPISGTQMAFYQVHEVAVAQPLDTDADGLDDVYELLRPTYLNPLDASDGSKPPPTPTIFYPTNATTAGFVIFSGQAASNTLIRVAGGAAYVTNVVDESGGFEVTVPLFENRLNRLFVSAVNEFGDASPPAPIDILQDSTPPYLFIDFPTNGTVLTADSTLVAGRVGDGLSGFLGLNVTVNGQAAQVDVKVAE